MAEETERRNHLTSVSLSLSLSSLTLMIILQAKPMVAPLLTLMTSHSLSTTGVAWTVYLQIVDPILDE